MTSAGLDTDTTSTTSTASTTTTTQTSDEPTTGSSSSSSSTTSATTDATTGDTETTDATDTTEGSTGVQAAIIDALTPQAGIVSTAVTITGSGFGDTQGTVSVDGVDATVTSWADTSIAITIPDVFPGPRDVLVDGEVSTSGPAAFDVRLPRTVYVNQENTTDNAVAAFAMDDDGALAERPDSPFATNSDASSFSGDSSSVLLHRPTRRLFVSGDTEVAVFDVDPVDGDLTAVANSPFSTDGSEGFGLTMTADGTRLYLANCTSNDLTGFDVEPATGALTLMPNSPFGAPNAICLDTPNLMQADSVLAATDEDGRMFVYTVEADGSLTATVQSPVTTTAQGFHSSVSPDGTTIYIPDTFNTDTDIDAWAIDNAGAATQLTNAPFTPGGLDDPHTMQFAAGGQRVYVASFGGSDVNLLTVAGDGSLAASAVAPFPLPDTDHSGIGLTTAEDFLLVLTEETNLHVLAVAGDGSLSNATGSPYTVVANASTLVIAE